MLKSVMDCFESFVKGSRLRFVLVGFGCVLLALLRQLFRLGAVAALVGLLRLRGEVLVLALLFTSKVAQAVVFLLGITGWSVVEGWKALLLVVESCRHRGWRKLTMASKALSTV